MEARADNQDRLQGCVVPLLAVHPRHRGGGCAFLEFTRGAHRRALQSAARGSGHIRFARVLAARCVRAARLAASGFAGRPANRSRDGPELFRRREGSPFPGGVSRRVRRTLLLRFAQRYPHGTPCRPSVSRRCVQGHRASLGMTVAGWKKVPGTFFHPTIEPELPPSARAPRSLQTCFIVLKYPPCGKRKYISDSRGRTTAR